MIMLNDYGLSQKYSPKLKEILISFLLKEYFASLINNPENAHDPGWL